MDFREEAIGESYHDWRAERRETSPSRDQTGKREGGPRKPTKIEVPETEGSREKQKKMLITAQRSPNELKRKLEKTEDPNERVKIQNKFKKVPPPVPSLKEQFMP